MPISGSCVAQTNRSRSSRVVSKASPRARPRVSASVSSLMARGASPAPIYSNPPKSIASRQRRFASRVPRQPRFGGRSSSTTGRRRTGRTRRRSRRIPSPFRSRRRSAACWLLMKLRERSRGSRLRRRLTPRFATTRSSRHPMAARPIRRSRTWGPQSRRTRSRATSTSVGATPTRAEAGGRPATSSSGRSI